MYKSTAPTPVSDTRSQLQVTHHGHLKYPHRLNFYDKPPLYDVTLEEFEICALNRLRILAEVESSAARNRTWDELKQVINDQCHKYLPLSATSAKSIDRDYERRRDHLSHYVLRLAFCRSEELRRRFVKAETTLFKLRYQEDDRAERDAFLDSRDFGWLDVDSDEKAKYAEDLISYGHFAKSQDERQAFDSEKYFKVKWTRVPDLVEKRKTFVKRGWAYVPAREQSSIVFHEFETHLTRALEMTARSFPRLDEDDRLVPILDNLSQGFLLGVPSDWTGSIQEHTGGEIKAEMIDDLAKKHFPLCMRSLHDALRRDHHLKHFGRLQYGLFLKVLGLSIEEAIVFWRKSFDRITDDKFNKEYRYNIRHSYGLEGRRANYPAKSCQQILTPGPSDHGCPYRHYSPENLESALRTAYSSQGLTDMHLPEVMALVKAGSYHVACTRVFELTHAAFGVKKNEGVGGGESVTHPNQYAARSMDLQKSLDDMAVD